MCLTGKYVKFEGGSEQQKVFKAVKKVIISSTMLIMPKFDFPFIIMADPSEVAVAVAVALCQLSQDQKSFDFIAFRSQKLILA